VDGVAAAAAGEIAMDRRVLASGLVPFVLRYRSTSGTQALDLATFALRYLSANGEGFLAITVLTRAHA
jgi:hypothetical protein